MNVHPSLLPDFAGGMDLQVASLPQFLFPLSFYLSVSVSLPLSLFLSLSLTHTLFLSHSISLSLFQVHQAVIDAKKLKSGCTVHFVTEEVDGGPIVLQSTCTVNPGETVESLKAKVQALEGDTFVRAVGLFRDGKVGPYSPVGSVDVKAKKALEILTYRGAGVDIDAGEALVEAIKPYCKATRRSGCDADLGGFGGLFDLSQAGYDKGETVLVSGTDGVGTKLKIAQAVGKVRVRISWISVRIS
jgi:hypothetical protein